MTRRDTYIVTAIAVLGAVAAFWFMALSPKREKLAAARQGRRRGAARCWTRRSRRRSSSRRPRSPSRACTPASGRLGKAVPADEDVPSLLVQLNHAAAQANVDFHSVELKLALAEKSEQEAAAGAAAAATAAPAGADGAAAPAEGAAPAAEGAQAAPPAAGAATASAGAATPAAGAAVTDPAAVPAAPTGGFKVLPFEYKFKGDFFKLEELIHNISRLVERRNQELAITGRLITIQGFTLKRGKITVLATTYMLPADQGLFAGATPQGPAGARGAAGRRRRGARPDSPDRRGDQPMNSVNSFVRTTIDDLVEKRLWPVAAVLLVALIAIPVLLANPADEQPASASDPVAPAVGAGGSLSAFQPAVNTEGKKSSEIRKDLEGFSTKDPFKPQNVGGGGGGPSGGSVEVQAGDASASGGGGSTDASVADAPPLGTSGGGSGDNTSTDTSGTTTPQTFYYTYTADVRFGKEGNLDRKTLSAVPVAALQPGPGGRVHGREGGRRDRHLPAVRRRGIDRRGQLRARRHVHLPLHEEGRQAAHRDRQRERRGRHVRARAARHRRQAHRRAREGHTAPAVASGRSARRAASRTQRAQTNPFARGFQAIGF